MAESDPLQAAVDAAHKMREAIMPKVRERVASAKARHPNVSLNRLAAMPDAEAEAALSEAVAKHGETAVTQELRRQRDRGKA